VIFCIPVGTPLNCGHLSSQFYFSSEGAGPKFNLFFHLIGLSSALPALSYYIFGSSGAGPDNSCLIIRTASRFFGSHFYTLRLFHPTPSPMRNFFTIFLLFALFANRALFLSKDVFQPPFLSLYPFGLVSVHCVYAGHIPAPLLPCLWYV